MLKAHDYGYRYAIAGVAAISGLLFGFDIAVINGAMVFLRDEFALTEIQTEMAAGALLLGCAVGASVAGGISDRFGRKWILLLTALVFAASAVGAALPHKLSEFILARLMAGLATGIASVLAPLYIAETAPASIRGRLVGFNQLAIISGILCAYVASWMLARVGANGWRLMFATATVPAVALAISLLFLPESPRWLVAQRRVGAAQQVLVRIAGTAAGDAELVQIRESIARESRPFFELFVSTLRRPLIIAVMLAVLQQVTGVNTVLFYGSLLIRDRVHGPIASALGFNVAVGVVMLVATVVALYTIDHVGRKPLLMGSAAGMAVSLTALGLVFLGRAAPLHWVLVWTLVYVFSFGVGLGPGVWVILSELFPTHVRGRMMAVATVVLWLSCLLLTVTFLSLLRALGPAGTFWLYAAICVFTVVFVWRAMPETKGRTLEEIEQLWRPAELPVGADKL